MSASQKLNMNMIKTNKCKSCDRPVFSKGYCQQHSPKTIIKAKSKAIKQSRIKTVERKEATYEKRNIYFDYHLSKCTHSEESNTPINNPNKSNICHIFSKSLHPSLEDSLENCIYLQFSEHELLDNLLLGLRFDKVEEKLPNTFNKIRILSNKLLDLCQENTVFTRGLKKYLDGRQNT